MKKLIVIIISSLLLASCGNPLGGGEGTFVDQGHTPGITEDPKPIPHSGVEFNPLSHTYEMTSGGRFKVSAAITTTNKPATLTQSGRYKVYSTVQGQLFSGEVQ